MTDLEREIARERDYERWLICKEVYRVKGGIWFSTYQARPNKRPRNHEIQSDLVNNECRMVLGKHWD